MPRPWRQGRLPLGTGLWIGLGLGLTLLLVGRRIEAGRRGEQARPVTYRQLAAGQVPPGELVKLGRHTRLYDMKAVRTPLEDSPVLPMPDLPEDANVDPNTQLPQRPGDVDLPNQPRLVAIEGYYPILPPGVSSRPAAEARAVRVWVATDEFNYDDASRPTGIREGEPMIGRVLGGEPPQAVVEAARRVSPGIDPNGLIVFQRQGRFIPGPGRLLAVLGFCTAAVAAFWLAFRALRARRQRRNA
ncbi:MAG: hypothetical protein ACLFV7_11295 [Phycisphaerae bacterium]